MRQYEHLEKLKERLEIFEKLRAWNRVRELRELIAAEERALKKIEAWEKDR